MVLTEEERKERKKEYEQKYTKSAKYKEYRKKYRQRPDVKAKEAEYRKKYQKRSEVRERQRIREKIRRQRPDVKAKRKEYRDKPEIKAKTKEHLQRNRLNVLQHYSKLLSNSDTACCNCCKESEIEFLAIDHIAGKKQMDSEPELIKLGYRSTLSGKGLIRWILNNNFPKGFQVLCTNCNTAKAYPKNNNKCPLEGKPHF